jgi:hypothetical protein
MTPQQSDSINSLASFISFRNKFLYLLSDKVNATPLCLFLPNDLFKKLNGLQVSAQQKAFAFSMYCLIKLTNWKKRPMPITSIKKLWGYSPVNKSLNKLVKSRGVLDAQGITTTLTQGVKENKGNTKFQYKEIVYDIDQERGFFKVDPEIMLFSMFESEKVGPIGFTIYCFLCKATQVQGKGKNIAKASYTYIANGTGLSEKTVRTYIKSLEKLGLIKVNRGESIHNGEYGEFKKEINQYSIHHKFNGFTYYNKENIKTMKNVFYTKIKVTSKPTFFDFGVEELIL